MAAGILRQSKTQEPLRIGIFHSRLIWEINHLKSGPIPVILALLLVLKGTEHLDSEMFYDKN